MKSFTPQILTNFSIMLLRNFRTIIPTSIQIELHIVSEFHLEHLEALSLLFWYTVIISQLAIEKANIIRINAKTNHIIVFSVFSSKRKFSFNSYQLLAKVFCWRNLLSLCATPSAFNPFDNFTKFLAHIFRDCTCLEAL